MVDFQIENGVLKKCTISEEECAEVVIPAEVTEIAANAFGKCEAMGAVVVPETVKRIAENAFDGCTALAAADIAAEETCAVPAMLLILRESVKKLGGSAEKLRALSAVRDVRGLPVVRGGMFMRPVAAVKGDLSEIGENAFCEMTVVCAEENSAAAAYARENKHSVESNAESAMAAQMKSYDRNIEAVKKELSGYARDLEAAKSDLQKILKDEEARLSAAKDELLAENARMEEELQSEKQTAAEIEQEILELKRELSGTFALAVKKKNELKEEIEQAEARLSKHKLRINTLPIKIHANEVEIENPLANEHISFVEKRIEKLNGGVEFYTKTLALIERRKEIAERFMGRI